MTNKKITVDELITDDKRELFQQLLAIDNSIPQTIEDVLLEITKYDQDLFSVWDNAGLKPKLATYLIHYVLPFGEVLQANKTENIPSLLASELLSFLAWRTFDNCVDGHESFKTAHLSSLASCMQFIGFAQSKFQNVSVAEIYGHYSVMAEQSFQEVEQPITIDNIWKRCSIIFFTAISLAKLDSSAVNLLKYYINYTGLAHDMMDIGNDISCKIVSLPVSWLNKNGDTVIINADSIKQLYNKARMAVEPIEMQFASIGIKDKYPLMSHLIMQASSLFHEK